MALIVKEANWSRNICFIVLVNDYSYFLKGCMYVGRYILGCVMGFVES